MLNHVARYSPVVDFLAGQGGGRLLEVGSGSRGIAEQLEAHWSVVACDRSFDDYGAPITGCGGGAHRVHADATSLPFSDRSFDAVVALDLLEHIPPLHRPQVLGELGRVADRVAIVGCPAGRAALEADRRLAARYRRLRRTPPGWLLEHLENGFPEPMELSQGLSPYGEVQLVGNESLPAHAAIATLEALPALWAISHLAGRLLSPPGNAPKARLSRALRGSDRLPTYRTIAILQRAKA